MTRLYLPMVLAAGDEYSPAVVSVGLWQHSGLAGRNLAAGWAASGRKLRGLETGCNQVWFQPNHRHYHLSLPRLKLTHLGSREG
jgi:hypothetical protein